MNNLTSYHPLSCSSQLSYLQQCCPNTEAGGVRHLILVDKYYQPTLVDELDAAGDSTAAQQAAWNRARRAGKLIVVPNILGEYDGGSPTEAQGYGGAQSRVTGMEHTLTVDDVNVVGNRSFADAVNRSQRYVAWFATERLIWNGHAPCGISATMPVDKAYTSEVKYVYNLKWSSLEHPQHYWLPRQLFDCADFSTAITLDGVVAGESVTLSFGCQHEQAATDTGTIILKKVTCLAGGTVTTVTTGYSCPAFTIALNQTEGTFDVTGPAVQDPGTYLFCFEVTGAGMTQPQLVEVTQVVL